MKKKILQDLWLAIVVLFIIMEGYLVMKGKYDDLFLSLMIVCGILLLVVIYFLIMQKKKK